MQCLYYPTPKISQNLVRAMGQLPRLLKIGDILEAALAKVGITSDRVSTWLGRPCKCRERRNRLNALGKWAYRVFTGKIAGEEAEKQITEVIGDGDVPDCKDNRSSG